MRKVQDRENCKSTIYIYASSFKEVRGSEDKFINTCAKMSNDKPELLMKKVGGDIERPGIIIYINAPNRVEREEADTLILWREGRCQVLLIKW